MKIYLFILAVLLALPAQATYVRYAATNVWGSADTNYIRVQAIGSPINANGSFVTRGPAFRMIPNASGIADTNLAAGNYVLSNAVLATNIIFSVPSDSSTNIYLIGDLAISGYNTYNYSPGVRSLTPGGGVGLSATTGNIIITLTNPPSSDLANSTNLPYLGLSSAARNQIETNAAYQAYLATNGWSGGGTATDPRFVSSSGTITAGSNTLAATTVAATTVTATTLAGSGSGITALNASQLSSGTVPMARLPEISALTNTANGSIWRYDSDLARWIAEQGDDIAGNRIYGAGFYGSGSTLTNISTNTIDSTFYDFIVAQSASGAGDLLAVNNLADVASTSQARTNLAAHNASNLSIGTVALGRLPTNSLVLKTNPVISGTLTLDNGSGYRTIGTEGSTNTYIAAQQGRVILEGQTGVELRGDLTNNGTMWGRGFQFEANSHLDGREFAEFRFTDNDPATNNTYGLRSTYGLYVGENSLTNAHGAILGEMLIHSANSRHYDHRLSGVYGYLHHSGSGTVDDGRGVYSVSGNYGTGTNLSSYSFYADNFNLSTGWQQYQYGFHAATFVNSGGGPAPQRSIAFSDAGQSVGGENYTIFGLSPTNYLAGSLNLNSGLYVNGSILGLASTNYLAGALLLNSNLYVNGDVKPVANNTYDLGSSSMLFRNLYLTNNAYVGKLVSFPVTSSTNAIGLAFGSEIYLYRYDTGGLGIDATTLRIGADFNPKTTAAFDLGSAATKWRQLFVSGASTLAAVTATTMTASNGFKSAAATNIFFTPSNAPTAGQVLTAVGTAGHTAWSSAASGSQTPWLSTINGGGYYLTNVGWVSAATATIGMAELTNTYLHLSNGFPSAGLVATLGSGLVTNAAGANVSVGALTTPLATIETLNSQTNNVTFMRTTNFFIGSNAISAWPTAPEYYGDAYMGNSNGVIYMLTATNIASLTWTATNRIAP